VPPFRKLFESWRGPLVADTYGPPLKWLVERPLALVKINREEFDRLIPADSGDKSELAFTMRLAETVARYPVAAWIITDGPKPVWCALKAGTTTPLRPPPVREVSPTGSGDVLLAALLHAHFNLGQSWPDALAYRAPTGFRQRRPRRHRRVPVAGGEVALGCGQFPATFPHTAGRRSHSLVRGVQKVRILNTVDHGGPCPRVGNLPCCHHSPTPTLTYIAP
jgi:hypothetical protein